MATTKPSNDLNGVQDNACAKNFFTIYCENFGLDARVPCVEMQSTHTKNKAKRNKNIAGAIISSYKKAFPKRKNKIHCDDFEDFIDDYIYDNLRDTNQIYKLPNCIVKGKYMYKSEAFTDPTITYVHPKSLPQRIINQYRFGYSHFQTTQLGVGYSSNSAGDGPTPNHPFHVVNEFLIPTFTGANLKAIFMETRTNYYYELILKNNTILESDGLIQHAAHAIQLNETIANKARVALEFCKRQDNEERKERERQSFRENVIIYFFGMVILVLVQLGVAYSSNNAGDGPVMSTLKFFFVCAIFDPHPMGILLVVNVFRLYFVLQYFKILFYIMYYQFMFTPAQKLVFSIRIRSKRRIKHNTTFDESWQLQSTDNLSYYKKLLKDNFKEPKAYHIAESLLLFMYDLSRSKTKVDILVSVGRFMREHYKGILLEEAVEQVTNCINILFYRTGEELQSEDNIFEAFRDYLNDFESLKQSHLYKKCYKLIMYILSYTLFRDKNCSYESFGYTAMEAAAMRLKYHAGPDMIYTILDTITFIGEKGFEIYKFGFSTDVIQNSSKYERYIRECREVKERAVNMNQSEMLDESELLNKIENLLFQGDDLLRCRQMLDKYELAFLQRHVNEIRSIKLDILSFRGATRARKAPLAILFNGNSGIGKSTILKTTIAAYCNKTGLPNEDAYIYTRNPVEEFWNNFRTYMHTLILDDIAFRNPSMQDSSSVDEIIQIMNDINFVPNQASLEDKGRIPFRCKFVVATTNTKDLNAYHYFSCPSAVQRRFPYVITPKVKPEYTNSDTGMLDPSLVPEMEEGCFPDLWTFQIELVTPAPIKKGSKQAMAKFTVIHKELDMEGYIDWLYDAIDKYNEDTTKVQASLKKIKEVRTCDMCHKPSKYCKCLQSATTALLSFGYWYAWWMIAQEAVYAFFIMFITTCSPRTYAQSFLLRNLNNPLVANFMFNKIKKSIQAKISKPELLIYFTGVAGSMLVLWRMYKGFDDELQGSNQSKFEDGRKPQPDENQDNENIWYKNDFELTTADVSRTILSSKSLPFEKLIQIFSKNCVSLTFQINLLTTRKSKAFAVTGQLYLTNNHCVPEIGNVEVNLIQQIQKEGVNSNVTFTLSQKDVIRMPEKDLCLIVIRCLPPKKNLLDYFPPQSYAANTHGKYLRRLDNGDISIEKVENIKLNKQAYITALDKRFDVWRGRSTKTDNGDCGTLLISDSSYGTCITGIHILGFEDSVVSTKVSREDVDNLISQAGNYAVGSNPPLLQSENENREISRLHPKSVYRYIDEGKANVYGSIIGFRPQNKTRVESTPIREEVEIEFGVKVDEVEPDMSYRPWRLAALDLCKIPNNIDTEILDKCVDDFANDIITNLPIESKQDLHVYDQFTSVNGAEGVRFVDKINRNTSAGFPFKRSKKYYIESIPAEHNLADPVKVNKEIQEQIDLMKTRLREYEISGCVFNAHLKDEPISSKKRAIGKTRVFSGANFPWTVIMRQYLLSFVRILQGNNTLFEAAIGVNHFSNQWEKFYQYLVSHGDDNCIAGDYSKFDKRMSPIFILAAFDFIAKILKDSGNYQDEDLKIIRCLAYDVAFAYQDFNGDLVQFFGGNPSGHSLTVIINGIVNSLYMRYAYYNLNPEKEIRSFKGNVNLLTYGDDNIANVSKSIPWFNHTAISDELLKIGVVYTMADKEAKSVPYISIYDCSFLKREWRFDEEMGQHMAPLDLKSVFRSLSVWVRSKSITAEEQIIEIIAAANAEFFSHGRAIFSYNQQKLKSIVHKHNLTRYVNEQTFMSYDDLIKRHVKASQY